jgi:hypothetical protein
MTFSLYPSLLLHDSGNEAVDDCRFGGISSTVAFIPSLKTVDHEERNLLLPS